MAGKCEICGKGPQFGHNRPFSLKATNRMWRPNVQKRLVNIEGETRRVNICTRCMRTLNKG
ncbi:MAG: 50S ribosomal protein L28 [Chloroflexi bacterium]|nr:50S ribosomal protein L28 [Chloroflexota bacterium]MBU1746567.1 50S ribosomal protein L28 [Chloroflexota bacterium]